MPVPAPITALSTRPGGVSLFVLGDVDRVWSAFYDPDNPGPAAAGGWHGWFPIGPNVFPPGSTVSAVSTKPGGTSLFLVGLDGQAWSTYWDPDALGPEALGGWAPWFSIGGKTFPLLAPVTAVSASPGAVDVFAADTNGAVWTTSAAGGAWQPWTQIGPNTFTPGRVTAVSTRPGGISLFAHGIDGRIWSTYRDPAAPGPAETAGFVGWFDLGPNEFPTPTEVAAVSTVEGGTSLFTLGYDGKVWSTYYDPAHPGWQPWFDLGPNIFPRPSTVSAISTRTRGISLFVLGFDGKAWSAAFEPDSGVWNSWAPIGGDAAFPVPATVGAVSTRPGSTSLFVTAGDGRAMTGFFDQGGWQSWVPVGSGPPLPSANRVRCIRLHVKILAAPATVPITAMIAAMDIVYRQMGVRVRHMTNEALALPLLTNMNVGACDGTSSADITTLFGNRNSVGADDVVAYFVQSVTQTGGGQLNGCATHPAGQDGATIGAIASPWTLAHEFGHVFGLRFGAFSHVDDPAPPNPTAPPAQPDRLMTGRGTWSITNPPPDITATEIATITGHRLSTDGTRM